MNALNGVNGVSAVGSGIANGISGIGISANSGINGIGGMNAITTLSSINSLGNINCQNVNGLNSNNSIYTINGINGHSGTAFAHAAMEQERSLGQNGLNGHAETLHWSPQYPMVCVPESGFSTSPGVSQANGITINKTAGAFLPEITLQVTNAQRAELQTTANVSTTTCNSVYAPVTNSGPRYSNISLGNPITNGIQAMQITRPVGTEFTSPIMKFMGPTTFIPLRQSAVTPLDTITHG